MYQEFRPVFQPIINQFEGRGIVGRQLDSFPQFVRRVRPFRPVFKQRYKAPFSGLERMVAYWEFASGAGLPAAKAGHIVFVTTKRSDLW